MKKNILVAILLICLVSGLYSSVSRIHKWKGSDVFGKAENKNLFIDKKGYISLAPDIDTLFQSTEIFLWDCAYDSKGNLYVSSGNTGKVFKVTSNGQMFTIFEAEDGVEIFAVAVDKNDNIFVGESPSGKVYKITRNGESKVFFESGEKYIWDLLFDKKGMLFVATGERGKLFIVDSRGEGEVYYGSKEKHIVVIHIFKGRLYAGTEPDGLFLEIKGRDEGLILYDSQEDEIHSIAGSGDAVYFASVSKPSAVGASSYASFFGVFPQQNASNKERSIIYKYELNEKSITAIWQCITPPVYSIAEYEQGRIIVGTEKGGLYIADREGNVALMGKFEMHPLLKIRKNKREKSFAILTGNLGNVIRLGPDLSREGSIRTEVFDTGRMSSFGMCKWDVDVPSGTSFSLLVRTGNRKMVDEGWTDWRKVRGNGNVDIPVSRFVQMKGVLKTASSGKSPLLRHFSISYLPVNRAPLVTKVVVCPVGINAGENRGGGMSAMVPLSEKDKNIYLDLGYDLPQMLYALEKGKRCIYWEATDPDGDSLEFSCSYRGEGEEEWKLLEEKLNASKFIWDETALPDGIYFIKVSAIDRKDNPAQRALTSELVSEPLIIDNTDPKVSVNSLKVKGDKIEVTATADDELSVIKEASYSVNGGDWEVIIPEDGIFDREKEEFTFSFKKIEKNEYTVVVKVIDFSLNTGTGKGTIKTE
jgi:hypothetical protein